MKYNKLFFEKASENVHYYFGGNRIKVQAKLPVDPKTNKTTATTTTTL